MSKIKVLQVMRPASGGMKEHVQMLLKHLNQTSFELALVCPRNSPLAQGALQLGIAVFPLEISAELSPWQDVRAILQLAKLIKQVKPAIVHAHGAKAGLLTRLASLTVRKRPALVLTAHNFVHTGSLQGWKQKAWLRLDKYLDSQTEHYITVSQGLRAEMLDNVGITPNKITTVYNGLDLTRFLTTSSKTELLRAQVRGQYKISSEVLVVGTVARFAPQKGLEYFVTMAACLASKHPEVKYLIIGDGPLRTQLEAQASSLGLSDKVIFAGYQTEIVPPLLAMDIFVLPSLSEGLGISILEALACKRPVVATRVGGIPEIITDGENGILVAPRAGNSLAGAVAVLLADQQYANAMAERGFQQLATKFSIQKMIAATEEVYYQTLKNRWHK